VYELYRGAAALSTPSSLAFDLFRRRKQKQPRRRSPKTAAPPTAIPAIAPVERTGEEFPVVVEVALVEVEVAVALVGIERVAVRIAISALRVKYTGRSRLSQVAGAVTVAPPKEL
jgi:hypothetical protein